MSTPTPTPSAPPGATTAPPGTPRTRSSNEIKLISHSNLYYWWPVWVLAFFMAAWTYFENDRLAILPPHGTVKKLGDGHYDVEFKNSKGDVAVNSKTMDDAVKLSEAKSAEPNLEVFRPRISANYSLGSLFVLVLVLTIIITNVPLRGLWSFLVLLGILLVAVLVTLFKAWDEIFQKLDDLHIHINLAGYLTIGTSVFVLWALATWVFDRRAYVIFTPGQIKVCEHIGDAVQTYPTLGIGMEKQRDDLFRHYILGFGSGDLILKLPTGEKREIRLPNVLGIGWRLKTVEDMLRTMSTSN